MRSYPIINQTAHTGSRFFSGSVFKGNIKTRIHTFTSLIFKKEKSRKVSQNFYKEERSTETRQKALNKQER